MSSWHNFFMPSLVLFTTPISLRLRFCFVLCEMSQMKTKKTDKDKNVFTQSAI